MRKIHSITIVVSILAIAVFRGDSGAAETCGNGVDDNSNGQTDEGCYPTGTTGVCESPLSCGVAGAVSPDTGALVYRFAPDVTAEVAYGPSLSFQRVYTSQYNPGYVYPSASNVADASQPGKAGPRAGAPSARSTTSSRSATACSTSIVCDASRPGGAGSRARAPSVRSHELRLLAPIHD